MPKSPKKLKIGLVIDTSLDPTDGVQQYVVSIGGWLSQQGHEVHYLAGQTQKRQLPNVHSLARNITVTFNGNRTTIPLWASRRKLRRFIKEQKFDVLHVQTPHHPFLAQRLVLAAMPDTAVVGTFHILPFGVMSRVGTRLLGIWLRPSLKRFDRMLAVSPTAATFEEQSFGLPAEVLPNVIDYEWFHEAKPLPQYDDDTVTILFLGRLVPRKGCQLLLEAITQLAKKPELPAFRVIVCGRGQLEASLKQYIAQHKLDNIVTFTGFVPEEDKPRYYASADISVFPSSGGESFGIVLLEAMTSGKAALLAGDNPGYRSVLSTNTDVLFDPNNAQQLANKIEALLTDDQLRKESQAWGEAFAKDFDINTVGKQLLTIYEEALRKRRNT